MLSVEQAIWKYAEDNPCKIAVKSGKDKVTYQQLASGILSAKAKFHSLPGYNVGSTIIIAANKQIEFLYAYFGAHLAGLVVAPIDVETNPCRLSYIINAVKPFCIIGFDKIAADKKCVSLKDFIPDGNVPIDPDCYLPKADNVKADILFTTGTTGDPKGVLLSYANEAAAARNINEYIKNSPDDIELLALPISHSFGLGRLRCCLYNGQTIILLGSFVNVKRLYRTIEEEAITGFSMVPSAWRYLQKMSGDKLSEYGKILKYIEIGSAFLSEEEKKHLAALFPSARVTMHYGLTEASRSAFMEFHEDVDHLSSVGKPSPYTDIQIFDEKGEKLGVDELGEICIKGEHVTEGYIQINKTDSFYGDYFRTGDLGIIDANGYIYLKSRIKEIINVGGKKVAPGEVEECVLQMDGIDDCACVAAKDPEGVLGEVVKAYVVRRPDSVIQFNDIKNFLYNKIESYKIPVLFEWIDSIPRTYNGKIQRNLLRNEQ